MQELFRKYAEIDQKFRILEDEKNHVRSLILKELEDQKIDKVESPYGFFTVAKKTSWIYSPAIKKIEERLKIAKDKEQQLGKAEPVESHYLLYKGLSEERKLIVKHQ